MNAAEPGGWAASVWRFRPGAQRRLEVIFETICWLSGRLPKAPYLTRTWVKTALVSGSSAFSMVILISRSPMVRA